MTPPNNHNKSPGEGAPAAPLPGTTPPHHPSTPPMGSSALAEAQTPPRRLNLSEGGGAAASAHPVGGGGGGAVLSSKVPTTANLLPPLALAGGGEGNSNNAEANAAEANAAAANAPGPAVSGLDVRVEAEGEEEKKDSEEGSNCNNISSDNNPQQQELYSFLDGIMKERLDVYFAEAGEQTRRGSERMLAVMQQESAKRTALEQRFHSQLLLQSEAMVAMELKLLRLEAKLEGREIVTTSSTSQQQLQQQGSNNRLLHQQHPRASSSSWRGGGGMSSITTNPRNNNVVVSSVAVDNHHHHHHVVVERGGRHQQRRDTAEGMAVITGSGASLASGVTSVDEPSLEEAPMSADEEDDGLPIVTLNDTDSTPTFGSRQQQMRFQNLESILLNPMVSDTPGNVSTRAVRGDADSIASWATRTSVATGSTLASTVVTSATRGAESLHVHPVVDGGRGGVEASSSHSQSQQRGRSPALPAEAIVEEQQQQEPRSNHHDNDINEDDGSRSRSQSPLTVQDYATVASNDGRSIASASLGASVISSMAVAPRRGTRPLADRVVSFTPDIVFEEGHNHHQHNAESEEDIDVDVVDRDGGIVHTGGTLDLAGQLQQLHADGDGDGPGGDIGGCGGGSGSVTYEAGATDSITMPDELDNMSEVADALVTSVRVWREEYEARLDALQKRWANDTE